MIKNNYYVYMLECADGSLYTGIATDVKRRFKEHGAGKGGHYTRSRGVVRVVYKERGHNRSSALKREAEIKRLSREKKLRLIGPSAPRGVSLQSDTRDK